MEQVYIEKKNCSGCNACYEKCPQNAISMQIDEEGFKYPIINIDKCIDCGLCRNICAFKKVHRDTEMQKYYAAKNKDLVEREISRSGGVFFVLAKYIINKKGIVYGVALNDDMKVEHIRATSLDECKKMQGSKYVQSDLSGMYYRVKEDLQNGAFVLFSGTACQIAGLYGYLGSKKYNNLLTVDIICHGTASPLIFSEYINFLEKKYQGKVDKFDFRDKTLGWDQSIEAFWVNNKKRNSNQYSRIYGSARAMRPSCYVCPFTSFERPSDITLGDFWGIEQILPEFNDNKGVSLVIVNSEIGESILNEVRDQIKIIEVSKEMCGQPNLYKPTIEPSDREKFWSIYKEKGIKENLKIWGAYKLFKRVKFLLNIIFLNITKTRID